MICRRFPSLLSLVVAPLLLSVASSGLPTPESTFGFRPGADYKLFTYEQSIAYFRKLAEASKSIILVEAGKSTQGRVLCFALVSSPKNLSHLDRYREISRRLAHPHGLTDTDARRLAAEGKPFIHIDGGLHASEVAGAQMMPQLAYDLLSRADDPEVAAILDNVIFMLWPTINPDGQTMVADWFMSHVGMPDANAPLPRLYQEYVGHDNNRDAYMLDMIESRLMEHTWRQWEPSVVYVQHQAPPFPARIFVPPFAEPIAPHAPPVISQEINAMGMAIAKRLDEHGLTGAIHGAGYDAWYPGYIDYMPVFKNIPAFWTETAGNGAVPREYTLNDIPANMREPKTLYPSPWRGGSWRLADAVKYDETAAMAVLDFAAKYKESLLFDRYLSGRGQIAAGRTQPPYAYVVPETQRDPVAAVELLRRVAFGGVAVSQLRETAALGGVSYPAGTWIVPLDQEFAAVAREVFEVQKYPERASVAGESNRAAVRCGGLDVAVADGRAVRHGQHTPWRRSPVEDARARDTARSGDQAARLQSRPRDGRVAVRQCAGSGFRCPSGRGGNPPARRPHTRHRAGIGRQSRGEQRLSRHQSCLPRKPGRAIRRRCRNRGGTVRHQRPERGGSERDRHVSCARRRAGGVAARRVGSKCGSPCMTWPPASIKGGRDGCSTSTGFNTQRSAGPSSSQDRSALTTYSFSRMNRAA